MIYYILIIVLLSLWTLDYVLKNTRRALLIKKIPGGRNFFLIGNALEIIVSPVTLFGLARQWAKKYGTIYKFYSLNIGAVNIYTPDDIEVVISGMKHHEKSEIYHFLRPWLKDGLLLSNGKKWQQRRKILTNAFHFNVLKQYFTILEEKSRRLVETLEKKTSGGAISVVPIISEFTLNSICESAMGTQLNNDELGIGKLYKDALHGIIKVVYNRFIRFYLHPKIIFDWSPLSKQQFKYLSVIHDFTKNVILNRRKAIENNEVQKLDPEEDFENQTVEFISKKKKPAMLDLLIAAEKEGSIDKDGIQEEVDTFMFEGHDTTSAGLTYLLMSIANNPDVQDLIVAELRNIFDDTEQVVTMDDLNKLQYLERCIKESMRLYPPVPFIGRKLKEDVKLSNYIVPAGILCHIHIYDLHRRPDLYENPLEFDPDRFLPENCAKRHNFAYLPFSAGPRNCIGQKFAMIEMKLALIAILRNFELQPVTRPCDLKFTADLVLRNSEPVYIKFIKRDYVVQNTL